MLHYFRQKKRKYFISVEKETIAEGEILPVVTLERKEEERLVFMSEVLSNFLVTYHASPMFPQLKLLIYLCLSSYDPRHRGRTWIPLYEHFTTALTRPRISPRLV
jgi:hypothetical protein